MEPLADFTLRFYHALQQCKEKYDRKIMVYKDSWKTANLSYLEDKLLNEAAEFIQERSDDHLVDIVNFALMILERRAE